MRKGNIFPLTSQLEPFSCSDSEFACLCGWARQSNHQQSYENPDLEQGSLTVSQNATVILQGNAAELILDGDVENCKQGADSTPLTPKVVNTVLGSLIKRV
eukprot:g1712.t1